MAPLRPHSFLPEDLSMPDLALPPFPTILVGVAGGFGGPGSADGVGINAAGAQSGGLSALGGMRLSWFLLAQRGRRFSRKS